MTTLFISDLHLDASAPAIADQFLSFLDVRARRARALYILGDLFEAWIGDDDPDPDKRRVIEALRALTRSGVPCWVMHGNRDFLLGRRFMADTGARLLDDGAVIDIEGERVLLMHGDLLCTDDHSYQRLRHIVRNPLLQWVVRRLSLATRQSLAARMRAGSQMHTQSTAPEIMDVNAAAVQAAFRRAGVRTLIHGHTHRPAIHDLEIDGHRCRRIVLGAWHAQGSVLEWQSGAARLESLPR